MNKSGFTTLVCVLFLTQVWAAVQRITIYDEPEQNGDSVTFTRKYANLSEWKLFLNKAQSFCYTGFWYFTDLPDFENHSSSFAILNRTEVCYDKTFASVNSARFQGPEDFDTPGIALYEGNTSHDYGGREYVVTGAAGNGIEFTPRVALSYGNSSWTLFTGKLFDGNSTCFTPNSDGSEVYTGYWFWNRSFVVQSVVKGCDHAQVANKNIFLADVNVS